MTKQLKTSVVLASYNGEKYILEQLKSLKNQTRKIDEVLIVDDRSTDDTVTIVQTFIDNNGLENWQIKVNEQNLGWRDNFIQALSFATNDIIFTCDQDDIWMPEKIETMAHAMEQNPNIGVLVTDYVELIEHTGTSSRLKKIHTEKDGEDDKVTFREDNVILKRPGCVFAMRKKFLPVVQNYYNQAEKSAHDISMWAAALSADCLYYIEMPLIQYRRHGDSSFQKEVSNSKKQNGIYRERINTLTRFNVRLDSAKSFLSSSSNIQNASRKQTVLIKMEKENSARILILEKRSFWGAVLSIYKYQHAFPFFADLYHILKLKGKRG